MFKARLKKLMVFKKKQARKFGLVEKN